MYLSVVTNSLQTQQQCIRYKKLATVIQRYGHMYYHFLEETLPRYVV